MQTIIFFQDTCYWRGPRNKRYSGSAAVAREVRVTHAHLLDFFFLTIRVCAKTRNYNLRTVADTRVKKRRHAQYASHGHRWSTTTSTGFSSEHCFLVRFFASPCLGMVMRTCSRAYSIILCTSRVGGRIFVFMGPYIRAGRAGFRSVGYLRAASRGPL